jgi:DNA-binding PadR family transcriptional regulator
MARELNVTEWTVLALVAEGQTHGFAVARTVAPGGPVGSIWSTPRPLVYRALEALENAGLIEECGTEPSDTGPPRRLVATTDAGDEQVQQWLSEPVEHLRDARSQLLLKLLFLHRGGGEPAALLDAQRDRFREQLAGLEASLEGAEGFDRTALAWRIANARAAIEFLDAVP